MGFPQEQRDTIEEAIAMAPPASIDAYTKMARHVRINISGTKCLLIYDDALLLGVRVTVFYPCQFAQRYTWSQTLRGLPSKLQFFDAAAITADADSETYNSSVNEEMQGLGWHAICRGATRPEYRVAGSTTHGVTSFAQRFADFVQ